jgi:hypothetical protein
MRTRAVIVAACVGLAASAIGGVGAGASAPPATDPGSEPAAAPESAPTGEWEAVVPGGDCACADGAEFNLFVRDADPAKVVLFLEGGGACFDATSCAFTEGESTLYDWNIGEDDDPGQLRGIFDLANPANPFADHSFVYVPYCTGDIHLGDVTREYSPELTVEHRGWANGNAAVGYLAEQYAGAEQVVVIGESAGSIAAAVYAGLVADALPDAQVTVFADGSGGYVDDPTLNAAIGGLWNVVQPPWAADVPREEWSIPAMVESTGLHDPDIVMSRFDYAYDNVQLLFMSVLGLELDLLESMDANEARIEAAGVNQYSFTAPGADHTLVRSDDFYGMELGGVRLVDWVTAIVNGEEVEDVHCDECEAP